ncbi:ribose ABC transporter substrate-binding protein RbsB [Paenibacillus methanolicus]|uniref:Ribose transport system substrate-binding protein n=1 Tax=Paenibacillus methanolicus TaxID=582686 RepID=A0A5S5CDJ0_9BACL|nr:ribose ABC transporter substrate-binding protein RbsB [Paenibacillus methanolicus]TYP76708.1 ribose transport system substrate-binding protein [Paenibacillus methanolicus]
MKKRLFGYSLLLASIVLLSGCSMGTETNNKPAENTKSNASDDQVTVGLSISTQNNPFFVTLKEGAMKAATALGAELVVVDAQDDTAKQISGIEDLISQKVDVILINPTDSDAVATAVESANDAGIPVITVDRSANGGTVVTHIASDNVKGGQMAGDYILEAIGGKGNIVELQGTAGTSAARDRGDGFHKAVDGKEGVNVIASQPADFDRAKGLSVMENILQGNEDIQAVFAHNDEMALGALQAIEAAGKKGIIVVGFDATDDALTAVGAGTLAATVAQKPDAIGVEAVQTAVKVAKGETVEGAIPVELELVSKK